MYGRILSHFPGHGPSSLAWGQVRPSPEKMVRVEVTYSLPAGASRHRGHVIEVGVIDHGRHGGNHVLLLELGTDMSVEDRSQVAALLLVRHAQLPLIPCHCGTTLRISISRPPSSC